jgi:phosphoserine phosphatase RsbX
MGAHAVTTAAAERSPYLDWGVASVALPGERESGDTVVVRVYPKGLMIAVIDGLGHGREAAAASRLAANALMESSSESLTSIFKHCHDALIGSRGAVISVAAFNPNDNTMSWLGVGNVGGILVRADPRTVPRHQEMLVRGGVVGLQLPPLHTSVTTVTTGDVMILVTDGIRPDFRERIQLRHSPQQLADRILAEYGKGTDDALVVVGRYIGGSLRP